MRTYVRARVLRETSQRSRCIVAVLLGGAAKAGSQAGWRQPPRIPQVRGRNLADPDGPLRSAASPHREVKGKSAPAADTTRACPRKRLELQPHEAEATPLRVRPQDAQLRALRPGGGLARGPDVAHSGPRERGTGRQPHRESPNRLSKLCCHD